MGATQGASRCLLEVMTHLLKLLVYLSAALAVHATARAAVADGTANAYLAIPASNVFRLQPVVAHSPRPAPVPLPGITLAGITTFERKCVLLKVRVPATPGEPAKERSCILAEGQRAGPIEVLEIDPKKGSVKVNNSGTVIVLTFEKEGPVLRNTPTPPPLPP